MVDQWIKNNAINIVNILDSLSSQEEGEGPIVYATRAIQEAYMYGYIAALKNTLTIEDMQKMDKYIETVGTETVYCHYLYIKKNTGSVELNLF